MFNIQILDNIAPTALTLFAPSKYLVGSNFDDPDVILVRSRQLHHHSFLGQLKAVGRAGVGTDNIPVASLTTLGIPVFYAPGANANAVKELVLAAMLIGYRHLDEARTFLSRLGEQDKESLSREIESQKKKFVGHEISGKTLGVIGLGNIGVKVANAGHALGMRVLGYDPHMTLTNALALMPSVEKTIDLNTVLSSADIITLHVPLTADTTYLINEKNAPFIKSQALLLNFSREQVISEAAIIHQLETQNLLGYITDFPTPSLAAHPQVLSFPHLGASTTEAEANSAEMVIRNISNYLEFGTIEHSINYPDTFLSATKMPNCYRLVVINHNQPGVIAHCTQRVSQLSYNIERMVNTSKENIAVNLIDISGSKEHLERLVKNLLSIEDIIRVHIIPFPDMPS
ncbi:3-phosphoglycerate dehydrogenase family protein [Legionella fallonii]|uniref:D-3-phosphoglycerate dehydrogenase n=1 Tax=Legionella fallonii LLAP-10 TaxID=1212491 RepID=A0A098G8T1_9GAMM|nr:3-phosphoglycerate dehydrogenase family protein [Legionella fallonii]CEG58883.1 putative D-isomer specific 2-hydroxyacid dehydrogenase [Legionella fallonii LLAP-10]